MPQETPTRIAPGGGILDADTHVAEPPEMWDYLEPEWLPRRPVTIEVPEDTVYGGSDHMWLIDGSIFPKAAGQGGFYPHLASRQLRTAPSPLQSRARPVPGYPLRIF